MNKPNAAVIIVKNEIGEFAVIQGSVSMFHLAPIRLWRNISIIMVLAAAIAVLLGPFFGDATIVIQWGDGGIPANSAGKWCLWVMLLLAVLSLFTHSSFSKRRPGFQVPVGKEMACAMSAGLVSMFSLTDITLVVYNFFPSAIVPVLGTVSIVCSFILCVLAAWIRGKHGPESGSEK